LSDSLHRLDLALGRAVAAALVAAQPREGRAHVADQVGDVAALQTGNLNRDFHALPGEFGHHLASATLGRREAAVGRDLSRRHAEAPAQLGRQLAAGLGFFLQRRLTFDGFSNDRNGAVDHRLGHRFE
jgi:hypothetical protein